MPQRSRYRQESPVATSASLRLRCNDRTRPGCGIRNLGAWTTPSSANSGAVSPCCLRSPSLQGPFREGKMSQTLSKFFRFFGGAIGEEPIHAREDIFFGSLAHDAKDW